MPRARVLLLGDSMRLSFQDRLARLVSEDGLEVVGPAASSGGAASLAEGAAGWVEEFSPDIACFGCGPWATEDLVRVVTSGRGVEDFAPRSLGDFERDLLAAVSPLQRWCGRQLVFFNTPPVHEARIGHASGDPDFGHRVNSWIAQYNQIAEGLLGELNVGVADLHHYLARHDEDAIADDGVSLSPVGVEIAAREAGKGIYGVVRP